MAATVKGLRRQLSEIGRLHDRIVKLQPGVPDREAWAMAVALWMADRDSRLARRRVRESQRELEDYDEEEPEDDG